MCRSILRTLLFGTLAVFLVFSGYMLAVLSFHEDVWIDYRSGARRTTYTLFPFSLSTDHTEDAFLVLFGKCADDKADWEWIESRTFVDPTALLMGQRFSHRETQALAVAETELVIYLLRQEIDIQERRKLSKEFYDALDAGGVSAAIRYTNKLLSDALNRQMQEQKTGR